MKSYVHAAAFGLAGALFLACDDDSAEVTDAADAQPADSGAAVATDDGGTCSITVNRVRCAEACAAVEKQQTITGAPNEQGACIYNAAQGCLVELASGDLYTSPTRSYFPEILQLFRVCTDAEQDEANNVSTCTLTITRHDCAAACNPVEITRTFTEQRAYGACGGNGQVGCLYELATGDLWFSPTTSYMDEMFETFRQCTPEEDARMNGYELEDAGSDAAAEGTDGG